MLDFGINDFFDVVLVASLLFYCYRLIRRSSAASILLGIIVFFLFFIGISQLFNLRILSTILDKIMGLGAIAMVILFQDELRHFFSTIGSRQQNNYVMRLFRKKISSEYNEHIISIVLACKSMSQQKVGALIIIERHVGLLEYINSGERIDAEINNRLIQNIFFKNSPLHDGAMIISGKRIKAAGCILPVSHDSDIPKNLGLRHRAALGISQKTDALSIIVSEETGAISVAKGGNFYLDVTADDLENYLSNKK